MGQSFQILQVPVHRHLVVDARRLLVRFNFWRTEYCACSYSKPCGSQQNSFTFLQRKETGGRRETEKTREEGGEKGIGREEGRKEQRKEREGRN